MMIQNDLLVRAGATMAVLPDTNTSGPTQNFARKLWQTVSRLLPFGRWICRVVNVVMSCWVFAPRVALPLKGVVVVNGVGPLSTRNHNNSRSNFRVQQVWWLRVDKFHVALTQPSFLDSVQGNNPVIAGYLGVSSQMIRSILDIDGETTTTWVLVVYQNVPNLA